MRQFPPAASRLAQLKPNAFIRRLNAAHPLTPPEWAFLADLPVTAHRLVQGAELHQEGEPVRPQIILTGWACRAATLVDGRRQIFEFLLPGDSLGLTVPSNRISELTVTALTPLMTMDGARIRQVMTSGGDEFENLMIACRRLEFQSEARLIDQVIRLGQLSAYERVAHLMVELWDRSTVAMLNQGGGFPMPLTQGVLADAMGISVVHVNRILKQLRLENLAECVSGRVIIGQGELLRSIAALENRTGNGPRLSVIKT